MQTKTVIVIDGGGRGAALAEAYIKSKKVKKVIAIPGNDLMAFNKNVAIYPQVKTTNVKKIVKIAQLEKADIVDVAQDDAVANGLVDALRAEGIKTFGPTKLAGQIEWDKAWSRNFMKKLKIPSPKYKVCKSQQEGIEFIKTQKENEWFIKAAGLAAGKGALYAKTNKEALKKIKQMKNFKEAGKIFLIEECLHGEEFSSFAIISNKDFKIVGHAQDHKRVFDRDKGPNTGGMGCSSPPMIITSNIEKQISAIFKKTVEGLAKLKLPYVGILYLGGMVGGSDKVYVIEFNARWGDPEAQVIIPSIKNDFYNLISNGARGNLPKIRKDNKYRIVVTAASKGYPGNYSQLVGKEIKGLDKILRNRARVFGAGVQMKNKRFIVNGGRLFYVLGEGKNVAEARKKAYNVISLSSIRGGNLHYRKDIGYRDLQRTNVKPGEKHSIH